MHHLHDAVFQLGIPILPLCRAVEVPHLGLEVRHLYTGVNVRLQYVGVTVQPGQMQPYTQRMDIQPG